MPSTAKSIITLAVAGFVLISAIITGGFPLGLAGSVNSKEKPKLFWSLVALVCAFVLFVGYVV